MSIIKRMTKKATTKRDAPISKHLKAVSLKLKKLGFFILLIQ
jgi:hypothetical protein